MESKEKYKRNELGTSNVEYSAEEISKASTVLEGEEPALNRLEKLLN